MYRNDICHKLIVGHVPLSLPKVLFKFLQPYSSIHTYKGTAKRVNRGIGYGLEISVTSICTRLGKAEAPIRL